MSMALRNCGRDILFSACNWGAEHSETWMRSAGAQMYRSTTDIRDSWQSIKSLALSQLGKIAYSGSYCFNDMDMLVCGMNNKGNVSAGG
jgi:alpha-galactosidase